MSNKWPNTLVASASGTQTAAWFSTGFLPDLRNKSSTHLWIWAIHSCFSVAVAAYTTNDLVVVRISQPLRYWLQSSIFSNETSSKGIMCCLLYFFLPITILP
uniref:Uncharacterized protein n=1 Tax=Glossina austeni TaxID=7395 RepID=A0A1A9ULN5_GLOAU